MKAFIIICGKNAFLRYKFDIEAAITWAENHADHSKEVIVREITDINII